MYYPFTISDKTSSINILVIGIGKSGNCIIESLKNRMTNINFLTIAKGYDPIAVQFSICKADMVIITFGLGGNTGSTLSPKIAKMAMDAGVFTIGVSSIPFGFEGKKRAYAAQKTLENLKNIMDSIVVLPNDNLLPTLEPSIGIKESFQISASLLSQTIKAIVGIILSSGETDINLDLDDLRTILSGKRTFFVGWGEYKGHDAATKAISNAMISIELNELTIKNASDIIIHFYMNPEFHFMKLSEAMDIVHKHVNDSSNIIFATTTDKHLPIDYIQTTIIATEVGNNTLTPVNNIW